MTILAFPDTTGKPTDGSFTYEENGVIYSWTGEYWAANNAQGFDQRYVNADGDQMTGDLTVPSLNGGPLAGLRNQLINGDFRIAQRGDDITTGAGSEYTTDRFRVRAGTRVRQGGDWGSSVGLGYTLRLERAGGTWIRQGIELNRSGRKNYTGTYTLSFYTNDVVANLTPTVYYADSVDPRPNQVAVTVSNFGEIVAADADGYRRVACQVDFDSANPAASNLCCIVDITSTSSDFHLAGIQLEPGSQPTPFEHRPIGLELQLCQRYYQKLQVRRINGETNWYTFPTKMRIRPDADASAITTIYDDSFGVVQGAAGRLDAEFDAEL